MEETTRNIYEITFYTKEESAAPVKEALVAHGGTVVEEHPFEKVRFEFPIRKESFAFLGMLRAAFPPEEVVAFSQTLSRSAAILRFLITKATLPKEGSADMRKEPERKRPSAPRATPSEPPILTNEAIEKKIEEILQ